MTPIPKGPRRDLTTTDRNTTWPACIRQTTQLQIHRPRRTEGKDQEEDEAGKQERGTGIGSGSPGSNISKNRSKTQW